VKQNGQLLAMAGERMKPKGFTGISGVCARPDHRGRGFAWGLMRMVAARILERGEIPFLHVYASNVGAIAPYESLGFLFRREVTLTVLLRDQRSAGEVVDRRRLAPAQTIVPSTKTRARSYCEISSQPQSRSS